MLLSPGVLGHLPSGLIDGIERIVGQVALCATTLAADQSHRLQLREQVLAMPIDVQHAVHGLTRGRLLGQHQAAVLRFLSKLIGHTDRSHSRLQPRVIRDRLDTVPVDIHRGAVLAQTFFVIGRAHDATTSFH